MGHLLFMIACMPHAHIQFHARETARHKRDTSDRSAKNTRLSGSEGALSLSLSLSLSAPPTHTRNGFGAAHILTLQHYYPTAQSLSCSTGRAPGAPTPSTACLPPCRRATIPVAPCPQTAAAASCPGTAAPEDRGRPCAPAVAGARRGFSCSGEYRARVAWPSAALAGLRGAGSQESLLPTAQFQCAHATCSSCS